MSDSSKKARGTYQLPYVVKAEWTTYFIFSLLFGPIALLWLVGYFKNPVANAWAPLLILFLVLTLFLVWAAALRVILEKDRIIYQTLFSRRRELFFSDVKKVKISIGLYYQLNLFGARNSQPLTINMKPFSRRNLAIIIDAVASENQAVELDRLSVSLVEGDFKPIISAGVKNVWQVFLWIFWIFFAISLVRFFFQ